MKIACIGGGPAGLFLSILLKKRRPGWDVAVYEQNPRGNTFGWGIVFSDGTMENLRAADAAVARATEASLAHWDDIAVHFRGEVLRSSGHGFIGVGRHRFLEILEARAEELGVALHFEHRVTDPASLEADLVVAADGVNSAVRSALAGCFGSRVEPHRNRFTWLGTRRPFEAFTFDFRETPHGWFQAHCYQFSEDTSTCIVECRDRMQQMAQRAVCQKDSKTCRNRFGVNKNGDGCFADTESLWVEFTVTDVPEADRQFGSTDLTADDGTYFPGKVVWLTGDNAGREVEVDGQEVLDELRRPRQHLAVRPHDDGVAVEHELVLPAD